MDPVEESVFAASVAGGADITCEMLSDGHLVPWYLMASYLYYHKDIGLMRDEEYDKLCFRLLESWDRVRGHPHRKHVDKGLLSCGSGYAIAERKYPLMVRSAAMQLAKVRGLLC